jgi:OTU domain-containing protein 6
MAEQNSLDNIEDEASRQRRERRELQSTIQQLKKSINKNDKTRKKKVDSEIQALEDAFAKRWNHFNENTPNIESNQTFIPIQSDENLPEVCQTDEKQHISRKSRRLANKEKRQAEINANQEVIDYDNQPESIRRRNEELSIDKQLSERNLELRSVPSDGNCLFASIVDQTSDLTIRQLRDIVADYLRKHRNEYEPFIDIDYDVYCEKLSKENIWGGQIELEICAKILQRSIEVIQGNGNEPIKINNSLSLKPPIIITYHRYLYTNGEHYNSTTKNDIDE